MEMDSLTCGLINGPVTFFNVVANAFFFFCMVRPLHGEKIKHPLKLLLWSLICCTIIYLIAAIVLFFTKLTADNSYFLLASNVVFFWSLTTNMSSSVWLNFFYYTQIVPARSSLFIWIKKNIKSIIYCIWLVEKMYFMLDAGVLVIKYLALSTYMFDGFSYNFTTHHDTIYLEMFSAELHTSVGIFVTCMVRAHFIFCLCVMVMSSGSTVLYLSGHMRRMVANGQSLSGPQFRGQVRVTITGILQVFIYMFYVVWTIYMFISPRSFKSISSHVHFTIINLYMSGTTLNLGAGQAVFRQRAAHIWLRAAQCCRAPQVQQSDQEDDAGAQTRRPGLC